jgi:hypothetical protein
MYYTQISHSGSGFESLVRSGELYLQAQVMEVDYVYFLVSDCLVKLSGHFTRLGFITYRPAFTHHLGLPLCNTKVDR